MLVASNADECSYWILSTDVCPLPPVLHAFPQSSPHAGIHAEVLKILSLMLNAQTLEVRGSRILLQNIQLNSLQCTLV